VRHRGGDVPVLLLLGSRTRPLSMMGKFTLREHIAGLRKNDQLLLMLVMSFLLINVFNIRGGGYMYFITYVLGGSTGYTSLFFTMVTFASILGSVIINPLSRRFDTVKLYYYTNLVLAALAVMMWFLPTGRPGRPCGWRSFSATASSSALPCRCTFR
jgi:Na+/melibiose symporter-like transporter